jgi:hypothetical protein
LSESIAESQIYSSHPIRNHPAPNIQHSTHNAQRSDLSIERRTLNVMSPPSTLQPFNPYSLKPFPPAPKGRNATARGKAPGVAPRMPRALKGRDLNDPVAAFARTRDLLIRDSGFQICQNPSRNLGYIHPIPSGTTQRPTFNFQHSTFNIQLSTHNAQRSDLSVERRTLNVDRCVFPIQPFNPSTVQPFNPSTL